VKVLKTSTTSARYPARKAPHATWNLRENAGLVFIGIPLDINVAIARKLALRSNAGGPSALGDPSTLWVMAIVCDKHGELCDQKYPSSYHSR